MDLEAEQSILERLQVLEAKVAELTRPKTPESPETAAARITSLVGEVDRHGLAELLRETPKAHWPSIFALQPLEVLQKVRYAVSTNAWNELVETWQQFPPAVSPTAQASFARLANRMSRGGRILIGDGCDLHTKLSTSTWIPETESEAEERRRHDELETAEARQWFREMLVELV